MQSFMKMKKKVGMTESTRQVLNKAIDLLHRLSNKKLTEEAARRELSTTLSTHFLSEGGVEAEKKIKLQLVLEEANEVITQLERSKIPLYEAIMMVNRIVVSGVTPKETKIESIQFREESDLVSQEFDVSGDQKEKNLQVRTPEKVIEKVPPSQAKQEQPEELSALMNRVVLNKKELEESVSALNRTLQGIGFELRPLSDR